MKNTPTESMCYLYDQLTIVVEFYYMLVCRPFLFNYKCMQDIRLSIFVSILLLIIIIIIMLPHILLYNYVCVCQIRSA